LLVKASFIILAHLQRFCHQAKYFKDSKKNRHNGLGSKK